MSTHAILSPSSAHRWMRCPASVRATAGIPNADSPSAADGRLAHEYAAAILLWERPPGIPEDWLEPLTRYVDYCQELLYDEETREHGQALIETPVRISAITGTEGDVGTVDFAALLERDGRPYWLHVVDLKFGQGILVDAEDSDDLNPQLAMYAAGLLPEEVDPDLPVSLHVFQPRRDHVSVAETTAGEILDYVAKLRVAAERTREPDAEFVPGVKQCRFCPIRGSCKARQEEVMSDFADPVPVTDEELADFATKIPHFLSLAKHAMEEVGRRLRRGAEVGGFKFVHGRSARTWGPDAAEKLFELLGQGAYTAPVPELIGIGAAEKLLGKKHDVFPTITIKPVGALKLVGPEHPGQAVQADPSVDFHPADSDEE